MIKTNNLVTDILNEAFNFHTQGSHFVSDDDADAVAVVATLHPAYIVNTYKNTTALVTKEKNR